MTKLSRLLLASALLGSAALPAMAQTGAGASATTPQAAVAGTAGAQRPATPAPGAVTSAPLPTVQAGKPATPAAPHAATAAPHAATKAPAAAGTRTN